MILNNVLDEGTAGQEITVANSASSGDAFSNVYAGIVYAASPAHRGLSALIPAGSATSMIFWDFANATTVALRMYMHVGGHNGAGRGLVHFRHAIPGNALACSMQLATNNRLRVQDKVNGAVWTAPSEFPTGQWIRLEALITQGSGTGDGEIRVAYYDGDSTAPLADSGTLMGVNIGGDLGPIMQVRLGRPFGTMADDLHLDSLALHTAADASGLIGPLPLLDDDKVLNDYRFGYNGSTWSRLLVHPAVTP